MNIKLSRIRGAFDLPRPNWETIRAWIERRVDESDHYEAWSEVGRQWLEKLDRHLGRKYFVDESENFLFLVPRDYSHGKTLLTFAEESLEELDKFLGDAATEELEKPLAVLLFADQEDYFRYEGQFLEAHEVGPTSGFFSKRGFAHIAISPHAIDEVQLTLVHELAHASMAHLDLPRWVEEGITQLTEEGLHALGPLELNHERLQSVRDYFHEFGVQDFWWGRSFYFPDEGQDASYVMARMLAKILTADHYRQFAAFLTAAQSADAGESAATEVLGLESLGDLAAKFLGEGSWRPSPTDPRVLCSRGEYYLQKNLLNPALNDFKEALGLDPRCADAYAGRGWVAQKLGDYEHALADYERAVRLEPTNVWGNQLLGWFLATCPSKDFRDGARAVQLAGRACQWSGHDDWASYCTLAAAFAEAGDFREARMWIKRALRLAPEDERTKYLEYLEQLRGEQPIRDDSTG